MYQTRIPWSTTIGQIQLHQVQTRAQQLSTIIYTRQLENQKIRKLDNQKTRKLENQKTRKQTTRQLENQKTRKLENLLFSLYNKITMYMVVHDNHKTFIKYSERSLQNLQGLHQLSVLRARSAIVQLEVIIYKS